MAHCEGGFRVASLETALKQLLKVTVLKIKNNLIPTPFYCNEIVVVIVGAWKMYLSIGMWIYNLVK